MNILLCKSTRLVFLFGLINIESRFFWFLCGNEVYTDSFFRQIAIKVLPDKHFTLHKQKLSHKVEKSRITLRQNRMEIANSNDLEEIEMDWSYLKNNVVPQLSEKIDLSDLSGLIFKLIDKLL
jgi:hypothetical protein